MAETASPGIRAGTSEAGAGLGSPNLPSLSAVVAEAGVVVVPDGVGGGQSAAACNGSRQRVAGIPVSESVATASLSQRIAGYLRTARGSLGAARATMRRVMTSKSRHLGWIGSTKSSPRWKTRASSSSARTKCASLPVRPRTVVGGTESCTFRSCSFPIVGSYLNCRIQWATLRASIPTGRAGVGPFPVWSAPSASQRGNGGR